MSHAFFSIIIPLYNVEPFVARCLDSCVQQSFADLEILIVDDCGSDDSLSIARSYAKQDPRIQILQNPRNLGLFHTRARGVKEAKGRYCLFVDSDDFIALETCATLHTILQKQPEIDILHFGMQHYPPTLKRFSPAISQESLQGEALQSFLTLSPSFQSIWGKAIKTSIAKKAYEELSFIAPPLNCTEDGLALVVMGFYSNTYLPIQSKLYFYCHNPHSITHTHSQDCYAKKQEDHAKVLDTLKLLQDLYPQYTDLIRAYQDKIASSLILETRMHGKLQLQNAISILEDFGIKTKKSPPPPTYLSACILSLGLFSRWQTWARILLYLLSLGRIKR